MVYYVALAGEKVGPLTQFRLAEMLRDGELTAEHKVWHRGLEGWRRLGDVPSLVPLLEISPPREASGNALYPGAGRNGAEMVPASTSAKPPPIPKPTPDAAKPRPITRFWARYFDYSLVAVIVILFSDITIPRVEPGISLSEFYRSYGELYATEEMLQLGRRLFYALIGWHLLEGVLLALFGTTPGKALFGMRVTAEDGSAVAPVVGIARGFLVFLLGVGMTISWIMILAMGISLFRLMSRGQTVWDQMLRLRPHHTPLSLTRILLAIGAFFALLMLQFLKIQ